MRHGPKPPAGEGLPCAKADVIQVTLFLPSDTVVTVFLVIFDFSSMPAARMTFLRHHLFSVPVGEEGMLAPPTASSAICCTSGPRGPTQAP